MQKSNTKIVKQHNTQRSKTGMGDYNGTAIKQKVGRSISIMTETPAKKKTMGKPPKALA
jgi:hypothetical protein